MNCIYCQRKLTDIYPEYTCCRLCHVTFYFNDSKKIDQIQFDNGPENNPCYHSRATFYAMINLDTNTFCLRMNDRGNLIELEVPVPENLKPDNFKDFIKNLLLFV